ncbi:MAG TPA: class I tRNA ligase family protein [Patescibacteria group bacterium]|nr:class I tRNA ligase family protein [Patescibacteria group bacterium]
MSTNYNPHEIEKKWQDIWEKIPDLYHAKDFDKKPKFYMLFEFNYPSGDGLHMGHLRGQTTSDIIARKKRLEGYNVMLPVGWDAFGLPTENYAIKHKIHPSVATAQNIANFTKQQKSLGYSFDWSREIDTTDPAYYEWTQWFFLKFYENGLAYKKKMAINWCPSCKIGLANEEVIDEKCERCGTAASKKELDQWMLRITAYADKLLEGLKNVDYPERVKLMQENWIGKSEGSEIEFRIKNLESSIKVFTTRVDTLFGCTYIVLAPESGYIKNLEDRISNLEEVKEYINESKKKSNIERMVEDKEKTGVKLEGITAINPINGRKVEVWVADYVLADYGTGAIMAVPAHDTRDYAFAVKYGIKIEEVVVPNIIDERNPPVEGKKTVERKNIHAIVRDPKTGKYLGLKWKNFDWTTFPMGGIEEGEDVVTAAKREVAEETGFTNLKLDRVLFGQTRTEYFANHKDLNRISYTTAVLFELVDHTQEDISQKEKDDHDVIWLDESQLNYANMTHAEVGIWQEKMSAKIPAYTRDGVLINSQDFTGLSSEEARKKITQKLKDEKLGDFITTYHLRDWIFSRQHYWGEPIPIVYCPNCGEVAVPEDQLPVLLPEVENYEPTEDGQSPLAKITDWVNTTCPKCNGPAVRETDTMPNWAGSSWYFLRYIDPHNDKQFADFEKLKYWMPVDIYEGGPEHTTLHLLYSRFWNIFFHDLGLVPTSEPYAKRINHGMILAEDGKKMSKSLGNVVNPNEIVEKYGADTARAYEMFIGPFEQDAAWSSQGIEGVSRFLNKVWNLGQEIAPRVEEKDPAKIITDSFEIGETELEVMTHKTIKKFNEDLDRLHLNTLVSTLMEFTNFLISKKDLLYNYPQPYMVLILLLSPICPHIAEEIWQQFGFEESIFSGKFTWPKHDPEKIKEDMIEIVIQENGKHRGNILMPFDASEEDALKVIQDTEKFKEISTNYKKIIYVKNRLVNFVR